MESVDDIISGAMGTPPGDVPPQAEGSGAPERETPRLSPKWKALHTSILDLYTGAQLVAYGMGDLFTAELIGNNAEACATAWVELAKKDKKVENLLNRLTTGSAWGGVIMAHAGIIIPTLARRGILPGGALFGAFTSTPEPEPTTEPPFPDDGVVTAATSNGANAS